MSSVRVWRPEDERFAAMHAYFQIARAVVEYSDDRNGRNTNGVYYLNSAQRAVNDRCTRAGVSWEERDALLAMAGNPFATSWSIERYGLGNVESGKDR